jgi:acetyl esterase/lipase
MTLAQSLKLSSSPANHRIAYGLDPEQFGDLRLPKSPGPHPVAILFHGGCWRAVLNLHFIGSLAEALAEEGIASWNVEYRRVGNPGGGWPGTFEDASRGAAHLLEIARRFDLDLSRVVAVGHSAGGHLALWLGAQKRLVPAGAAAALEPIPLRGVVSLAGVSDVRGARENCSCSDMVEKFMGGTVEMFPERYRLASPAELLPLGLPQRLIHGAKDGSVPLKMSEDYTASAKARGDDIRLTVLPDAGHFELIAPQSSAWKVVIGAVRELLGVPQGR